MFIKPRYEETTKTHFKTGKDLEMAILKCAERENHKNCGKFVQITYYRGIQDVPRAFLLY